MASIRNNLVRKLISEIRELREKLKECTCGESQRNATKISD